MRFGSANPKSAFWLAKFLEDVGYIGSRHFDAHTYRTEDYEGVKDCARGCMRTYLMLKEKAARWNADNNIQSILAEASRSNGGPQPGRHSKEGEKALLAHTFDLNKMMERRLAYERLDQLTIDILLGTRQVRFLIMLRIIPASLK